MINDELNKITEKEEIRKHKNLNFHCPEVIESQRKKNGREEKQKDEINIEKKYELIIEKNRAKTKTKRNC
jgi:hypothetical protein